MRRVWTVRARDRKTGMSPAEAARGLLGALEQGADPAGRLRVRSGVNGRLLELTVEHDDDGQAGDVDGKDSR